LIGGTAPIESIAEMNEKARPGPGDAQLLVQLAEAGDQHLDPVGGAVGTADMRGVGEADDRNSAFAHVQIGLYRWWR
jgi:hypothetical protein